jgi:hypothetical protein
LIGTDRRAVEAGVPAGAPDGLEAALAGRGVEDRLLGAAAAWTVARRAGAVPAAMASEVEPAGEDPRAIAPSATLIARLRELESGLLEEWLALAAARGLRPPPELVPALLDYAREDPSLHAAVGEAVGPLGRWLAERRPEWGYVRGAGPDVDAVWADGASDERRALLQRLRRTDPERARALVDATFAEETWEDRVAFVDALADGLSDADEPLLERALDDRRKPVREAAAHLLARLPSSRFAARMAERTAPLLRVEDGRLVAELPGEPDAAAKRDGVPVGGRRSERLLALLAATPLAVWTGGGKENRPQGKEILATPGELVALEVADDLGEIVRAGWGMAAVAQRDAEWARALWAVAPVAQLLEAVPHAEAQELAAGAERPDIVAQAVPGPWGPALTKTVIDAVQRSRAGQDFTQDVAYAGERLDLALADYAEERLRELPGRDVRRMLDVLAARAAMLRELS